MLIYTGREIMEEWGDEGALRPDHIREAYRRWREQEKNRGLRHSRQPLFS